jgi:glycosyltransferase involved in cell wall biosynthesis
MVIDSYDDCRNGATISTRRFVELLRKEHEVSIITTGDPAPGKVIMPHFYAPVVGKMMKRIYNRSSMVICPSKFAQDELKQYGLTAPSMVISNGILPMFKPCSVERDPLLADKFIVLSVGRFAPEKQQEIILQAIRISKYRNKIQLILIGEGPMKEKLQERGRNIPN